MALQSLDHVVMFVPAVRAAAEWYSSALGLPIASLDENFGYIKVGSSQLCFHVADEKAKAGHRGQVAYWRVSSLSETCALLARAGGTLYRGPLDIGNGEAICQMEDPFGNLLGLIGNTAFEHLFHNRRGTVEPLMPKPSKPSQPFMPADFDVPEKLETPEFRIRVLTVNDVVKDYDAVMTSVEHLKTVWPGSNWPEGLTFEQDLIDLGWHQKEFQIRRSFAYSVVTPSESQVIGCVYINPTRRTGFDAEVFLWARQSELAGGLEARLYGKVQEWLQVDWPFKRVAFPGRGIDWPAWRAIPLETR